MNDRFSFEYDGTKIIKNSALDCSNCILAYSDSTADCVMFKQKPISVLNGKKCKKKRVKKD